MPIKLNKDKTITVSPNITYYLNPDFIYIPINEKYPLVKQNQKVYKNAYISKSNITTISGKVFGMKKCLIMNTIKNTLVIQNDYREYTKQEPKRLKFNIPNILNNLTNKRILDKLKSNKTFDNIIINSFNDFPYTYNRVYLFKENTEYILDYLNRFSMLYKCSNTYITIKSLDKDLIDDTLSLIGRYPGIKLSLLEDEYPLEEKTILCDKLGISGNTLYLNIEEFIDVIDTLNAKTSTTKLITISGDAISSKVIRVKLYTKLKDIVDKFIEIYDNNYVITINGLMNGFVITNLDDFVITEDVEVVNIMKKRNVLKSKCINCGKCLSICPKHIDMINKVGMDRCNNCGLCKYICPVYIDPREVK